MKTVCQIATTQSRYDSRILFKQSASLVEAGFQVTIISADIIPEENYQGINIIPLDFVPKNRFQRFFKLYKPLLKKALDVNADIYQINGPENFKLALKLKKMGKKVVFDSREDHPANISEKKWIPLGFRKVVSYWYEDYEKRVLYKMDAVLTVTTYIYDRLKKINSNTHMITNYPIVGDDDNVPCEKIQEDAVCFVGTMSPVDKHDNVIKALSKTENTKYLIAYTEESKYLNELRLLSKSLFTRDDRVELVSSMPHSELPKFHSRAKAGIAIRSYAANYGYKEGSLGIIKFFDYLASGLPVICTDFKVWKDIIDEYNCGIYVNPYSVDEIAGAINFINNNPEKLKEMAKNARRAAVEKYNWKSQKTIYVKVYEDLI